MSMISSHRLRFLLFFVFNPIYAQAQFINDDSGWFAPPFETATLAVTALFFIVTIVQLIILLSYLCRGSASHMAPAAFVITNAFLLVLFYIMEIINLVVNFTIWGNDLPFKTRLGIRTVATLFSFWADAAMIIAVALIIRDRYVAHVKTGNVLYRLVAPAIICFLGLLVFILGSAYGGLLNKGASIDTLDEAISQAVSMTAVDRARVAFFLVATIFTLGFGISVKVSVASDTILNLTLFGILPPHILGAIASVVSSVYVARINNVNRRFFDNIDVPTFDFSTALVFGLLYVLILSILCYFYLNISYWNRPNHNSAQNLAPSGFAPMAQFPGQWGYTGQAYGGPVQYYVQPQQYVGGQPPQFLGQPHILNQNQSSAPAAMTPSPPPTSDQRDPPAAQPQNSQNGPDTTTTSA